MKNRLALFLAIAAAAGGCGGDDGGTTPDAAGNPPDAGTPDSGSACEPTAALPYEWRPIDSVSIGAISVTTDGSGVTSGTVDATAGGVTAFADNPYIYLDLEAGTKVDISDVDSYTQPTWDIALKRMVIRLDGGDSGVGGVEAAIVSATSLDQVTTPPADGEFGTDDWATETCELKAGMLGEPQTALGGWYAYDVNTHVLTPNPFVYVVRTRSGMLRKLRIATYYGDAANPMRGAYYQLEWAPL